MLGIQLSRDGQDAIVDGSDMRQLLLLRLPGDVGFPKAVWAEVDSCRKHGMFVGTTERKKKNAFQENKSQKYK